MFVPCFYNCSQIVEFDQGDMDLTCELLDHMRLLVSRSNHDRLSHTDTILANGRVLTGYSGCLPPSLQSALQGSVCRVDNSQSPQYDLSTVTWQSQISKVGLCVRKQGCRPTGFRGENSYKYWLRRSGEPAVSFLNRLMLQSSANNTWSTRLGVENPMHESYAEHISLEELPTGHEGTPEGVIVVNQRFGSYGMPTA